MIERSKWLNLAVSLGVMLSLMLAGLATKVNAASPRHTTQKTTTHKSTAAGTFGSRCKKRDVSKGLVKYSDYQFPDSLNTAYQSNAAVSTLASNLLFDGLVSYNNKAQLFGDLLTRIPSIKNGDITNGGKTITLHLKPGTKWSDGRELTSADVNFGWKVSSDKVTGPACLQSCDFISRIDTPNKYTAVLRMKSVYGAAIPYALPPVWPVSWSQDGGWSKGDVHAAALKLGSDPTWNFENKSFPTNGPYQVSEFVKDDRIVFTPMKYYNVMNCGPYVKSVIFAFYSSIDGMIAAAASRQTDITQDYTPSSLAELAKHASAFKVQAPAGFVFEHLEFNLDPTYNGQANPLANKNVRLALALSLDKIGLLKSALGLSTKNVDNVVAWTPLVNTPKLVQPFADKALHGQWDPLAKAYVIPGNGRALSDAKKLLASTPYKSGFSLDFWTTTGNTARAATQNVAAANWARLGIKTNVQQAPAAKLFGEWATGGILSHGAFQVALFAFVGSPDPDQLKGNLLSSRIDRFAATKSIGVNGNDAGIKDPSIDAALHKEAGTFDKKVRQAAFNTIQVRINQNAYWIPLYSRPVIATTDGKVTNFTNNPTQIGITWNTFAWTTKS
ncbi:MAG: ABC transporter substrate-binding protein [Chloroflexota bacterium]|nr:ABC transporter substrate-binding protein [Chloroflexota bacterium]